MSSNFILNYCVGKYGHGNLLLKEILEEFPPFKVLYNCSLVSVKTDRTLFKLGYGKGRVSAMFQRDT